MLLLLTILLIILAACAKAVMDKLNFHAHRMIGNPSQGEPFIMTFLPKWWGDPHYTWERKYAPNQPDPNEYTVPRFWGSTTIFVFLTDAWHFFQFIMLSSLFTALVLYPYAMPFGMLAAWVHLDLMDQARWLGPLIDFISARALFGLVFTLCFRYLLDRRFWERARNWLVSVLWAMRKVLPLGLLLLGSYGLQAQEYFTDSVYIEQPIRVTADELASLPEVRLLPGPALEVSAPRTERFEILIMQDTTTVADLNRTLPGATISHSIIQQIPNMRPLFVSITTDAGTTTFLCIWNVDSARFNFSNPSFQHK